MGISLVIPLAGEGARFKKVGWTIPKPLIPINGKVMVQRVIESFDDVISKNFIDQIVFVVRRDIVSEFHQILSDIKEKYKNCNVDLIIAENPTQGAACSVLLAKRIVCNSKILIADCDTSYNKSAITIFFNTIFEKKSRFAVSCFGSNSEKFSYIDNSVFPAVIAEKKVISNYALSGLYYFRSSDEFFEQTVESMIYGERDKGEFYISKILQNILIKQESKIDTVTFNKSDIHFFGTPEQLYEELKYLS